MRVLSRDDVIATTEFVIADLMDDGINGEYEMLDADGNSVGTVGVNINFEEGDGTLPLRAEAQPFILGESSTQVNE